MGNDFLEENDKLQLCVKHTFISFDYKQEIYAYLHLDLAPWYRRRFIQKTKDLMISFRGHIGRGRIVITSYVPVTWKYSALCMHFTTGTDHSFPSWNLQYTYISPVEEILFIL